MRIRVAAVALALFFGGGAKDAPPVVIPSPVYAETRGEAGLHPGRGGEKARGVLPEGTIVEVLRDYSAEWYLVKPALAGGAPEGWVRAEHLVFRPDPPVDGTKPDKAELEHFVSEYESRTDFLLFTDIARQRLYVFNKTDAGWKVIKTFPVSTGLNKSPTTRGTFAVSERGPWFYSKRLNSGAAYWLRFNGSYLFHSVAMDEQRNVIDPALGERRSSGCVRLSVDGAKWLYENIPAGTAAVVY